MSNAYFSPSLLAFIPAEWKDDGTYSADNWPADAVLATDDEVKTYWKQTPPDGQLLGAVDGRPAWVDQPALTQAQLVSLASQQKTALINAAASEISWRQDAVDLSIATDEETTQLAEWKKYRVLLNRVDTSSAPDITWPTAPLV